MVSKRIKAVILSKSWTTITWCSYISPLSSHRPYYCWHFTRTSTPSSSSRCVRISNHESQSDVSPCVSSKILYPIHLQVKQTVTIKSTGISRNTTTGSIHRIALSNTKPQSGTMLRVLGAARKREVKATQNLSIIVLFFMVCWLPLYTINCVKAFCPDCFVPSALTYFSIILSHLNSAVNPLLYAYHLKDFRAALKALIFQIFGKELQPTEQINYRFSLASQHKLNSILEKRASSLHPRIYIGESLAWLWPYECLIQLCCVTLICRFTSMAETATSTHER